MAKSFIEYCHKYVICVYCRTGYQTTDNAEYNWEYKKIVQYGRYGLYLVYVHCPLYIVHCILYCTLYSIDSTVPPLGPCGPQQFLSVEKWAIFYTYSIYIKKFFQNPFCFRSSYPAPIYLLK